MALMYNIGLSALRTHRRRLEASGHNLSNVDTPGYSRQRVGLSNSTGHGRHALGMGVDAGGARRYQDAALNRSVRGLTERLGFSNASSLLLTEAEPILGSPDENHLGNSMDSMFAEMGELTLDPGSTVRREAFLDGADRMAAQLRRMHADLERVRDGADDRVRASASEANRMLARVASLNDQIMRAENAQVEAPDLRDERDRAIAALSELMDVRTVEGDFGMVDLQTSNGDSLVNGVEHRQIVAEADPALDGHLSIRLSTAAGTLTLDAETVGGSIGGTIDARDGAIASQLAMLDDIAFDLATAINSALAGGTDLDGNTPGQPLFDVGTSRDGAAGRIQLAAGMAGNPRALALSGTGAAGDNTVALEILRLQEQGLVGATLERPSDAVANSLFLFADASRKARDAAETDDLMHAESVALRESMLGVSADEELVAITEAQRAFQGAAKVINAADEMTQEILALKR